MTEHGVTVSVQSVCQPIGEFFVGAMTAADILRISSFDFRRMSYSGGYISLMGIQRRVDPSRAKKIEKYALTVDPCFPTSIVLSVSEDCARIRNEGTPGASIEITAYLDDSDPNLNIPLSDSTAIIDGQHRLKGIEQSGRTDLVLPVTIFLGIDEATEAYIFSTVNLAQTKVNKSLVYDLFALDEKRSPERTCHDTVVALDKMPESPFQNTIKRLGTATLDRRGETLSQATVVKGLLPYVTSDALADRDRGKRFGFWDPVDGPENLRRIFRHFFVSNQDEKIIAVMVNYFSAIAERWEADWNKSGEGTMIKRTNGYLAFMRFLRPAYLSLTTTNEVPSKGDFLEIMNRVKIEDGGFNPTAFPAGSSGAKRLFDKLVADTGLK